MFIQSATPYPLPTRFQTFWKRMKAQPHPKTFQDRAICKRLIDLFEYELAASNLKGIHFYVQDAVVTLKGTVANAQDRKTLIRLVQQLPNVGYVVDHLTLKTE